MDINQTYETTIMDVNGHVGFSVLVIPARSSALHKNPLPLGDMMHRIAEHLDISFHPDESHFPAELANLVQRLLTDQYPDSRPEDRLAFSTYVTLSRQIPFETSPLGVEALASIAATSVKAGTVTIGATVGYLSAGTTPLLLITVPAGIVLCGAAVSFSKWLEENRTRIWDKLTGINTESDKHAKDQ